MELGYFYTLAMGCCLVNPLEGEFDPLENNFDSQFPLECDCASFEYQLGWICYAELVNLQPELLFSTVSTGHAIYFTTLVNWHCSRH